MKEYIKLISPTFLLPYIRLINNLFFREGAVSLKRISYLKNKDRLVVLGNGPSLDHDIEYLNSIKSEVDFMCVNNFACSELYETFQPNKYLFMDDYFFSNNAHPDWISQRRRTFERINKKTSWKLQVFLPAQADIDILKTYILNENVEFVKFSAAGYVSQNLKINFLHFNTGFFGPFQGNVLIYSIYLGIWSGYKDIKVFGADLSMHENVKVDQGTNELYMTFKHFNNSEKREIFLKNPDKTEPFKMHEFLLLTAETFLAHQVLNEYAKSKNVEIFNCSSYSLIDAYKRGAN